MSLPANPPLNPIGYVSTGVTTVVWGTTGLAQFNGTPGADINNVNSGYFLLTSFRQRLKKDLEYGENGSGVECRRTFITHGTVWDIEVEDNANMTPPAVGTTVLCYDILQKGIGGFTAAKLNWTATVVSSEYNAAPKRPGMRTITAENLTLVDTQPSS